LYYDKIFIKKGLHLDGNFAVNFGRAAREAVILQLKKKGNP
jgi:hypothetical protein